MFEDKGLFGKYRQPLGRKVCFYQYDIPVVVVVSHDTKYGKNNSSALPVFREARDLAWRLFGGFGFV